MERSQHKSSSNVLSPLGHKGSIPPFSIATGKACKHGRTFPIAHLSRIIKQVKAIKKVRPATELLCTEFSTESTQLYFLCPPDQ